MLPSRKRSKLNPKVEQRTDDPQAALQPSTPSSRTPEQGPAPSSKNGQHNEGSNKELKSKSSWYGTWPRKSTASTQVAKETILADKPSNGDLTAGLSRFDKRKPPQVISRPPSLYLGKSKPASEVTLRGTLEEVAEGASDNQKDHIIEQNTTRIEGTPKARSLQESDTTKESSAKPKDTEIPERPATSQGWLGWLGMPSQPSITLEEPTTSQQALETAPVTQSNSEMQVSVLPTSAPTQTLSASRSWFNLWSAAQPVNNVEPPKEQPLPVIEDIPDNVKDAGNAGDTPKSAVASTPSRSTGQSGGSGWASAFWYTDTTKKDSDPTENQNKSETGELAVFGDESQNHPAQAETTRSIDSKLAPVDKRSQTSKKSRPKSIEIEEISQKAAATQLDSPTKKSTASQSPAPPNLLLPSVRNTYHLVENPSIIRQLTRLIVRGRQKPVKHVSLSKEVPIIKNAVAIGVHGLFPAPLLRKLLGQPSGTSIRFANHAAAAIRRWADDHGSPDCEIEKVALDGEGKIFERVDKLWKLLTNWTDRLRQADYIMVAAHSQGVPVALMLIAKLIEEGIVSSARIGVCAMAGVSLGPFASHQTGYQAALFNEMITELFEFANYESAVAKRYEQALRKSLKYGVRITYCASIDDQLVSIESAIFSPANHPYIYRSVFVDGRIHAPDFIAHLVGFALKLRNLGVSDHGLIRELSAPLAGSLYTGGGHSRLYDDEKIYDMAIEHSLATTSVPDVPLQMSQYSPPTNANPYVLPWIMRGVLEEEFVKTELHTEAVELLKQFDDWKPTTKVLQDVKYRLEAVRSKL